MKTHNKIVVLAFLFLTLLFTIIRMQTMKAMAQGKVPGVKAGDWIEYFVSLSGNATLGEGGGPQPGVNYAKLTVMEVSGTNITAEALIRYENGTQTTEINAIDVDSGQGNGSALFIAANLTKGDLVYTGNWSEGPISPGVTINETILREYLGSIVEVNQLNVTTGYTSPDFNYSLSISYYWYKATGMMAEMFMEYWFQNETTYAWASFYGTVIGMVPEFSPILIIPLALAVTLVAVLLSKFLSTQARAKRHAPIS